MPRAFRWLRAVALERLLAFPRSLLTHRRPRRSPRPVRERLCLELLEDRTLLSGITGTVFNDLLIPNGTRDAGEVGVPGIVAYLDADNSGTHNTRTITFNHTATNITPTATPQVWESAPLNVSGIQGKVIDVNYSVNLARNNTANQTIAVIPSSPLGLVRGNGPNAFTMARGIGLNATFDDEAAIPIATQTFTAPTTATGTFKPVIPINTQARYIYDGDPNGDWKLVFFFSTVSSVVGTPALTGLTINSWSLTFTVEETSTTTDDQGNFAFNNLPAGPQQVRLKNAPAAVPPVQNFNLGVNDTATANFALAPLPPDLVGISFVVTSPPADWGSSVTVAYTIKNQGPGAAGAFDLDLRLSADRTIALADSLLQRISIAGLAAGEVLSGTFIATLPAGSGPIDAALLGALIDPLNAVAEGDENNNANQGVGIDQAVALRRANQQVTSNTSAQQQPSIAVDPTNANHLVMAYMDFSLRTNGYAGIAVVNSIDGGLNWSAPVEIQAPAGFNEASGYPTVAFDHTGKAFIAFMAATFAPALRPPLIYPDGTRDTSNNLFRSYGLQASNGVFVSSSTDGVTWGASVSVASRTFSGTKVPWDAIPEIAIDTAAASPTRGNIYVTFQRIYPPTGFPAPPAGTTANGGTDIIFAVSTNSGASFTEKNTGTPLRPVIRDGNNGADQEGGGAMNFPHVTTDATGAIYVSFFNGGRFRIFRSTNAGTSFAAISQPFPSAPAGKVNYTFPQSDLYANPTAPDGAKLHNFPVRQVVVDPTRPNNIYVLESIKVDTQFDPPNVDRGEINLARSVDRGVNFTRSYTVGGNPPNNLEVTEANISHWFPSLNDDNATRSIRFDTSRQDEVIATQTQPKLVADALGNLTVIWLDSRRDPNNKKFDVFATTSTDGGLTWSKNYLITDVSFDPEAGKFTDSVGVANGTPNNDAFFGDLLGLAASNGLVYAAWTDTRDGNQNIYFSRFASGVASNAPTNDRFEVNNTPATATVIGQVAAPVTLPDLVIAGGDEDWFQVVALADKITVNISGGGQVPTLQLDLFDSSDLTGTTPLASGTNFLDANGQLTGKELTFTGTPGTTYRARVRGVPVGGTAVNYTFNARSSTADLGEQVFASVDGNLPEGGRNVFAINAALPGSMEIALNVGATATGPMSVQVLSSDGLTVLGAAVTANPGQVARVGVPVNQGQALLIVVQGLAILPAANPPRAAQGAFNLQAINLDQFQTGFRSSLFFATAGTPKALGLADFNGDTQLDIVTASTELSNPISLLQGAANGLFWAPRTFNAGPGSSDLPGGGSRSLTIDTFMQGDNQPGVAVTNFKSADVSVLPGRGDSTLGSERRSDAVERPDSLASGDFNNDTIKDLIVLERNITVAGQTSRLAILDGRGDGTFSSPRHIATGFTTGANIVLVGRFNIDNFDDVAVFGNNSPTIEIYLGDGNGGFGPAQLINGPEATAAAVADDVDGDGNVDLVTGGQNTGRVYFLKGNGNGTFAEAVALNANTNANRAATSISGLAVIDAGDGTANGFGKAPDGRKDIIAVALPRIGGEAPHINFLPGQLVAGVFGFGAAQRVRAGAFTGPVAVQDVSGDNRPDIVAAEPGGVRIIYSQQPNVTPNNTFATAADFGEVVHYVSPERAIVPPVGAGADFRDAWFKLKVPTEAAAVGGGEQIIDFSALFDHVQGAGLQMEILDAANNVIATGPRVRVKVAQGAWLKIHVFGLPAGGGLAQGTGSYTLVIDVLPQVVQVEAVSAFSTAAGGIAGAATGIVITYQGDRLDLDTAEDPQNYKVTWLGTNGVVGGGDDQVMQLSQAPGSKPVIYTPGANTEVSSGRTYPTAIRHTSTLIFDEPLPLGSYLIEVFNGVQTAAFNGDEDGLLVPAAGFNGQPVVQFRNNQIAEGVQFTVNNLVTAPGALDFSAYANGTPFLTQFHNDLGALLNELQTALGDDPQVSEGIMEQIKARFEAAAAANPFATFLVIWMDPVSVDVADPRGTRTTYNLATNQVTNQRTNTFIEVGGNIEVIVMAGISGLFNINVADVQSTTARGGAAVFSGGGLVQALTLTSAIRGGETSFSINVPPPPSTAVASAAATTNPLATNSFNLFQSDAFTSLADLLAGADLASLAADSDAANALATALAVLITGATEVGGDLEGPDPPPSPILPLVRDWLERFLRTLPNPPTMEDLNQFLDQLMEGLRQFMQQRNGNRRPAAPPGNSQLAPPADEEAPALVQVPLEGFIEQELLEEPAPLAAAPMGWQDEPVLALAAPEPRLDAVLAAAAFTAGVAHAWWRKPEDEERGAKTGW